MILERQLAFGFRVRLGLANSHSPVFQAIPFDHDDSLDEISKQICMVTTIDVQTFSLWSTLAYVLTASVPPLLKHCGITEAPLLVLNLPHLDFQVVECEPGSEPGLDA
jgi:hypothetical protein